MSATEVLIAGAGPTGLNLALRLARYGIAFRIVDKAEGPGQASRAMVVHTRTLELYHQLGFAEDLIADGIPAKAMHLRAGGKQVATISFENAGAGLSPYPFALAYPQDDHERLLVEKLEALGHRVEWNTALTRLVQNDSGVEVKLARHGGEDFCAAAFAVGCDGGHSAVRRELGLDFPGGTYPNRFYVIDAKLEGDFDTDGVVNLGAETFALKLPVRSRGMHRLIGLVPPELRDKKDITFEDLRAGVEHLLALKVEAVNWFSSYQSHHRVAAHFRQGRCFIAGDAGHVHSPAGGQGMNTGIGDAVNLAWKLAAVLKGRADPGLLDSYEAERIAFARKLVATTDTAFRVPIRAGWSGRFLRSTVVPHVVPLLFKVERFRRFLFKSISQTRITYRSCGAPSEGAAGPLHGGDRLPWLGAPDRDNFEPLTSLDWQVHVYGEAQGALRETCEQLALPLHAFRWSEPAAEVGFVRDAAYLVRPDTYIGLVLPSQDREPLQAYIRRHGLRFGMNEAA